MYGYISGRLQSCAASVGLVEKKKERWREAAVPLNNQSRHCALPELAVAPLHCNPFRIGRLQLLEAICCKGLGAAADDMAFLEDILPGSGCQQAPAECYIGQSSLPNTAFLSAYTVR